MLHESLTIVYQRFTNKNKHNGLDSRSENN